MADEPRHEILRSHYTHRDLKPENFIFTTKEGSKTRKFPVAVCEMQLMQRVICKLHLEIQPQQEAIEKSVLKLIDFGLAREFAPDQARFS